MKTIMNHPNETATDDPLLQPAGAESGQSLAVSIIDSGYASAEGPATRAVAALSVMGGTTVGSAITGAVMGSRREIGALRGFLWGLLLPVVGIGRVWISDRIVRHDNTERTRNNNGTSQIAADAARKQYERDNPKRRYDRPVQVLTNEHADRQDQNISRSRRR